MLHFLLVPALITATATPASYVDHPYLDGATVAKLCAPDPNGNSFCVGYIIGIVDAYESERVGEHKNPCVPTTVSGRQLVDITSSWMNRAQESHGYAGPSIVIAAVKEAFKCE
jgi:hypothetical protein